MAPLIRVLLVEDHTLVRVGFRTLVDQLSGLKVVAEAADGRDALALVARYRPDVVLMDVQMPGLNGLEAAARIAKEFPSVRVLMLSMHANEEYVLQALRVGAAGYLLKGVDLLELDLAIRAVARGETYLTPAVSKQVIADYLQRVEQGGHEAGRLTARQREVLQLIAEGHTTKEIAHQLGLSVKTVEAHRTQLMDRLDIHDVAGLVRYAIRAGVASAEP